MDVLQYNRVELVPCEKVKYWAKQHERNLSFYIEPDGGMIITAEFADGKIMWVSTHTKPADVETNTEIIRVIKDTMQEPNSEWYAASRDKLMIAMKLGIDRLERSATYTVLLRENNYMDVHGKWHDYSAYTEADIAGSLADIEVMAGADEALLRSYRAEVRACIERMEAFGNGSGWEYRYSEIRPTAERLAELKFLKICNDADIRSLYSQAESMSASLYNRYQSAVR